MTIQQILTKIQNETYGEEVRQAIIDGLQLCYDDKVLGGYCPVDDLNNYYSGAAFCTSSVANGPSQSSFIVMSAGDSEHCFQVAINILNINDGYTRKKQNNTWSQWIQLGVSKKIRYWNHDGTELLYTESVSSGGNGTWTGTATKEPTQQYEYTFVGWSTSRNSTAADPNATRNITSNRDVYAAFTSSLRSYYVYFFNGTNLLSTVTVPYGSNALYAGEYPTKASTAQYDYSFVGWNSHNGESSAEANILNDIRDNKTVYAAFAPAVRSYNVYFYNGSELIFTDTVEYGSSAAHQGSEPTKVSTAQYSYAFSGWNANSQATEADTNALANVIADRNVYAMFTATIRTYTVRFMNGTTVLQTVENVPYGGNATYTGSTPQHPTEPDEYTFVGFDPDGTNIIGATDCQAVYILNPKTLRYWNYNGTELLHTESVEVGGDGTWNGTSSRASTTEHSYIFLGWNTSMNASVADPNATKNLTTDRDVYAAFEETARSYSVRFYNGSTLLYTDLVQYGENASYSGDPPTKASTAQYTYTFEGWNSQDEQSSAESGVLNNITDDKDVYAAFSSTVNSYNVYFYNGSTLLYTDTVAYGSNAAYSGSAPTKASTAQYDYHFEGWNSQDEQSSAEANVLTNITADKTVYAAFSSTLVSYNVYFYNGSTLLYTDTVAYGSNAAYSGSSPTKASTAQYTYTFEGWNSQDEQSSAEVNILNNITADKTVYAAFSSVLRSYSVYFYNGSTLLYTDTVAYGSNAVYGGAEPTKESSGSYEYSFIGWNSQDEQSSAEAGVLNNIVADKTVYAAYETIDPTIYIYGIRREYGATDPAWTRTDYSENLTATATYGSTPGHSDFDALPLYKDIKRVTLDTGDVMVQIPKFYFKRYLETDSNTNTEYECIKISRYPQTGFSVHPAFLHNNSEQDYIYVGAYLASRDQSWHSNAEKSIYTARTLYTAAEYRTAVGSKGSGWGFYDISTHSAIQMLYLIEFATNDSQTAIGKGVSNLSSPYTLKTTGGCDNIYNLTGSEINTEYDKQVVYRGIEDIWGNGVLFIDGVQQRLAYMYVSNNQSSYSSATNASGYSQIFGSIVNSDNCPALKMSLDENASSPSKSAYMFSVESSSLSDFTIGYCDTQQFRSTSSTNPYFHLFCSGLTNQAKAGLFNLLASSGSSDKITLSGGTFRLLYVPSST